MLRELGLKRVEYNGYTNISYGLYDTFIVSFARFAEFRRVLKQRPIDERSRITAHAWVPMNVVYYADEYGVVTKYEVEGD